MLELSSTELDLVVLSQIASGILIRNLRGDLEEFKPNSSYCVFRYNSVETLPTHPKNPQRDLSMLRHVSSKTPPEM